MDTYPIILGGVQKQTTEVMDVRFPYTGEIYAKVCQAGPDDIEQAVAAALQGFEKTRRLSSGRGPASFPVSQMRSTGDRMSWSM